MWNKIKLYLTIGVILSLLYVGWAIRHPKSLSCEHKWETVNTQGWGRTNPQTKKHENLTKIHELKCTNCGLHHSQRIDVNGQ